MKYVYKNLFFILVLGLTACGGSGGGAGDGSEPVVVPGRVITVARFDPGAGIVPLPSNILFSGSEDGTLNIPLSTPPLDPEVALSALDGFSTGAAFLTAFSSTLDSTSLVATDTVKLFEVTLTGVGGAVTGVSRELGADEFRVGVSPSDANSLFIAPLKPLAGNTSYMMVLLEGIKDSEGFNTGADGFYNDFKSSTPITSNAQLETLRVLVNFQESAAESQGVDPAKIIFSSVFTTQSIGSVLSVLANQIDEGDIPFTQFFQLPAPLATTAFLPGSPGLADVYSGFLTLDYYLDANNVLGGFWQGLGGSNLSKFNPFVVPTGEESVPLLLTVPNIIAQIGLGIQKPEAGWPIIIFQHGITQNRSNSFALADRMAAAGFAVVSMDQPLHGIAPTDTFGFLFSGFAENTVRERTFGVDFVDNATGAPGPDGTADASGTHTINLASLRTMRDNLRQASVDLMTLRAAIAGMDIDGDLDTVDFDTSKVFFLGHSLGGIVGTAFIALEGDNLAATALANPGASLPKLVESSVAISPRILAGLGAAGLVQGTPTFESFLAAAQAAVDSADPINYAAMAKANGVPIYFVEMIGGDTDDKGLPFPSDVVVPNAGASTVLFADLAGSEPLITALGLDSASNSIAFDPTTNLHVAVRFTAGTHGSVLSATGIVTPDFTIGGPTDTVDQSITAEVQTQIATFFQFSGKGLVMVDNTHVQ